MIQDLSLDYKIKALVEADKSVKEIAQILGIHYLTVYRKLNELKLVTTNHTNDGMPFGITRNSYVLRATLGGIVTDLWEKHRPDYRTISEITGLNRREISVARQAPYKHDWTLSQIERTLAYEDMTLCNYLTKH